MLTIVQDQKRGPFVKMLDQQIGGRMSGRLAHAQRRCDVLWNQRGRVERGQLDPGHAIGKLARRRGRRFHCQPRLATATHSGQRQQPCGHQQTLHVGQLARASYEMRELGGQARRPRGHELGRHGFQSGQY